MLMIIDYFIEYILRKADKMKNMKKFLCILLSIMMMLSLVACGKSDDSDEKDSEKDNKPAVEDTNSDDEDNNSDDEGTNGGDVKDIFEALSSMNNYKKGSFKINLEAVVKADDVDMTMGLKGNGDINGNEETLGLALTLKGKADDQNMNINLDLKDLLTITKDAYYVNLDSVVNSVTGVSTKFGNFKLPAVDVDENVQKELQAETEKLSVDFFKALLKDVEVKQDGNTFSVEVTDAEVMKKMVVNTLTFVKDNKEKINKISQSSAKSFDIAKYAEKVVEAYKDDLKGLGATDDDIKKVLDSVKETASETTEIGDMFEGVDFDEAIKSVNDADMEEFKKANPSVKLSVTVDKDAFKIAVEFSMKEEGKGDVKISYDIALDVKDVTISAPSNVAKITDIMTSITSDAELLTNLQSGLMKTFQDWGIDLSNIGNTEEPEEEIE